MDVLLEMPGPQTRLSQPLIKLTCAAQRRFSGRCYRTASRLDSVHPIPSGTVPADSFGDADDRGERLHACPPVKADDRV